MQVTLDQVNGPIYMDVAKGDWFAPYALWNRDHDLLSAKNGQLFPNALLTREEIAGIIYATIQK